MKKLRHYINSLTKEQRVAFFLACDTTEGYLRKACSVGQCLGSDLCILIEEASNRAVMCEDLRPDCNWAFIRAGRVVGFATAPSARRATDPAPESGHPGRQPPSSNNIFDTVPEHCVVGVDPRSGA